MKTNTMLLFLKKVNTDTVREAHLANRYGTDNAFSGVDMAWSRPIWDFGSCSTVIRTKAIFNALTSTAPPVFHAPFFWWICL
jgi:hypothetical protein